MNSIFFFSLWRYTNADMKILQYIGLHIKNTTKQVAHYNAFCLLRYAHFRYAKCLFTNIQKSQNMLKSSLLFKKNTNFTEEKRENSYDSECEIFGIWFLHEHNIWRDFQICISVPLIAIHQTTKESYPSRDEPRSLGVSAIF